MLKDSTGLNLDASGIAENLANLLLVLLGLLDKHFIVDFNRLEFNFSVAFNWFPDS